MSQCTKHLRRTVQGAPPCPHCEVEQLRERVATLQAQSDQNDRDYDELTALYDAEKKRAEVAEAKVAIALPVLEYYASLFGNTKAQEALAAIAEIDPKVRENCANK